MDSQAAEAADYSSDVDYCLVFDCYSLDFVEKIRFDYSGRRIQNFGFAAENQFVDLVVEGCSWTVADCQRMEKWTGSENF